MTYTHVIFDLDGTLLNTLEDLACAGNHVCEMRGWPTFTQDQFRYKVGNGQVKLVERLIPAEFAGTAAFLSGPSPITAPTMPSIAKTTPPRTREFLRFSINSATRA